MSRAAASRLGLTIPYADAPLSAHKTLLREAAAAGYTDFWTAETAGNDAFTPLALAAEWLPAARVGTAIIPAFTRGPALIAMSAATLAELAPDRLTLGIGSSSNVVVESWNGISFEKPLQRTRDVVRFLRAALRGDKVTESYETFTVAGFRLERPPLRPPKIVVAALRPRMLELAGTEADGAVINWLSAEDVRTVAPYVGPGKEIVARVFVSPSEDTDAVRAMARRMIASYLNVPVYAKFHEWLGRADALQPMWQAWRAGDRAKALELVPDAVVDDLVVHGSPAYCRSVVRRYIDNGVTVPVLAPVPVGMTHHEAALAMTS